MTTGWPGAVEPNLRGSPAAGCTSPPRIRPNVMTAIRGWLRTSILHHANRHRNPPAALDDGHLTVAIQDKHALPGLWQRENDFIARYENLAGVCLDVVIFRSEHEDSRSIEVVLRRKELQFPGDVQKIIGAGLPRYLSDRFAKDTFRMALRLEHLVLERQGTQNHQGRGARNRLEAFQSSYEQQQQPDG